MLAVPILAASLSGAPVLPNGADARIDRLVAATMSRSRIPGAVVAVAHDGVIVYRRAFGVRDVARGAAVDAGTRFEIGSVSKQFTAAAILRLAREGKLALDDRLARFVPDYRYASDVTLREMLAQTSGIPDTQAFAAGAARTDALQELLRTLNASKPVLAPGSGFAYSNSAYVLLARVVEVASGEPFETYVRTRVLAPAGIDAMATVADEAVREDIATGYRLDGERAVPSAPMDPAAVRGAGGLVANADELLQWNRALFGGRVLPDADVTAMTSPSVFADGSDDAYGLGLQVGRFAARPRIWHGGQTFGAVALDAHLPADALDVVVLANQSGTDIDALGAAIESIVIRAYDDAMAPPAASPDADPIAIYFRALAAMNAIPVPRFVEYVDAVQVRHKAKRAARAFRVILPVGADRARVEGLRPDGSRDGGIHIGPVGPPPTVFLARGSPASFAIGTDDPAAPSAIGGVHVSNYRITAAGREDANGCGGAYKLTLEPKHDPLRYNLRTLWVDAATWRMCAADVVWKLMVIVPTPMVIHAEVDPGGYLTHWSSAGVGHTPLGPYAISAENVYTDVRPYRGSTDPKLFRQ